MDAFENKSTNDIADSIIKSFAQGSKYTVFSLGSNPKRKIQIRRILDKVSKTPYLMFLEQRKRETQEWEIVFADITLISREIANDFSEDTYKYIGFDICIDSVKGRIYKTFFINFSYHSLKRVIERCDITTLSTPSKVKSFLSAMIKPIFLRCLFMYEEMYNEMRYSTEHNFLKKRESYIVYNGIFMPIVMEISKNKYNKPAFSFAIKTVMPDTYNGAQNTIREKNIEKTKDSIFDYFYLVEPYAETK